jgi:Fe-S-cluster-containing dehydrogenase component
MNVVWVELDRCMAGLSCERACQFQRARQNRGKGWLANIFVAVDIQRRRIYAGTCLQCDRALCIAACPVDALRRDPETTAIVADNKVCIGCSVCVLACPFGYMQLDESLHKATKCDLCGGHPKCVQMCMAGALHFCSIDALAERKNRQADLRMGLRAVPQVDDGQDGGR